MYYPRGVEPELFITQKPMTGSCLMAYAFSSQINLLFQKPFHYPSIYF